MKLTVIIVNYNVKYFLEQCLYSAFTALKGIDAEIIVVDNNSVDGSTSMIKEKFPSVKLIENKENIGFAKANNQALKLTKSEYVLLLNPDTVVEEDTFKKSIDFMEKNENAGAMGVKMIDGKGRFLPESKRSLPTPQVAFYKIFGLSKLFPRSKKFGRYHLSYLNEDEINEIDVLPGAYMFIKKKVLEEIGLLDEKFFMYGEDIDLSYRIKMAGYKIYYFPDTNIIHYKGESTKKGSLNYVRVFYNAMIIFARKHFSKNRARWFSFFIKIAVYLRASIALFKRAFLNMANPFFSIIFIYLGYYFFLPFWENKIFQQPGYYPQYFIGIIVPIYIIIWITTIYFGGGFDRKTRIWSLIKYTIYGTIIILLIYSLLPEHLRFSRSLILIGSLWVVFSTILVRFLLSRVHSNFQFKVFKENHKIILVGQLEECNRVNAFLKEAQINHEMLGYVYPSNNNNLQGYLGNITQLKEVVDINRADEIIFCSKDISTRNIIAAMLYFQNQEINFKIAPPESLSVIGSNSINTSGDLYFIHMNSVAQPENMRKKRALDVILSFTIIILVPITIFLFHKPAIFLRNIFKILTGQISFVGYSVSNNVDSNLLPRLKKGILNPHDAFLSHTNNTDISEQLNLQYAKDYKVITDIFIIIRGFGKLDRKLN